jgi:uncharacterized protein (DUF362 family)
MSQKMNRRDFLRTGAVLGASSFAGGAIFLNCGKGNSREAFQAMKTVSVVTGEDYFATTIRAVSELGGMDKFVPRNSRVAILANPQRNNPGTYTKPEVVRAVIRMCRDAGAVEVNCITWLPEKNWQNTGLTRVIEEEGGGLILVDLHDESLFRPVPVPQGKALKEARIMLPFFDHDVFIDLPITKDHAGNKFTGTLKNLMGLNSPKTNRTFHLENWTTDPQSIAYLDQCIADLNTVIRPHLCVVDATELITTNGPFGPGELITPRKVIAGTDRVAIDTYCCGLWGLKGEEILTIQKAAEHGLGERDLSKMTVMEITA